MKKLLALLLTFFASYPLFAQQPDAGMKSFSFGVNGLRNLGLNATAGQQGTFLFRKYTSTERAHRYLINIGFQNNEANSSGASGFVLKNTNSSFGFDLGYGFQRNLSSGFKLTPYWGIDFTLGTGYSSSSNRMEIQDSTKAGGKNGDYTETIRHGGIPIRVGAFPILGINYFLLKNFSVGAEFSYGVTSSYTFGGSTTLRARQEGNNLPDQTTNTPNSYNVGFGSMFRSVIMFSVYF